MNRFKVLSPSRLLTFLKDHVLLTTKDLRWSIEHGRCFVNGQIERFGSTRLKKGDEVVIWPTKRPVFEREEERVLFEDEKVLFYNKPPFIASSEVARLLGVHLVHRLDRDTTGVMLFAKKAPSFYEAFFRERKVQKTYSVLVEGIPKQKKGSCKGHMRQIGKREGACIWGVSSTGVWAQTDWECLDSSDKHAYLRCIPLTGRTHQIRVHLRALGHPIVGDCEYGSRKGMPGLFRPLLHARELQLASLSVTAPLPDDFLYWKQKLL